MKIRGTENPFCCSGLKQVIELSNDAGISDIFYLPQYRAFGVSSKGDIKNSTILEYCPFCGQKFLKDLCEEFKEFLLDDYGSDYSHNSRSHYFRVNTS